MANLGKCYEVDDLQPKSNATAETLGVGTSVVPISPGREQPSAVGAHDER